MTELVDPRRAALAFLIAPLAGACAGPLTTAIIDRWPFPIPLFFVFVGYFYAWVVSVAAYLIVRRSRGHSLIKFCIVSALIACAPFAPYMGAYAIFLSPGHWGGFLNMLAMLSLLGAVTGAVFWLILYGWRRHA